MSPGAAALVGPGCSPTKVSMYFPRCVLAGGGHSKVPTRNRKKIDTYILGKGSISLHTMQLESGIFMFIQNRIP